MAQHTCREQRTALGVGVHLRQSLSACCSCSETIGLWVCELLRILAFPPPSTVGLGSQTHEPAWLYTDLGVQTQILTLLHHAYQTISPEPF